MGPSTPPALAALLAAPQTGTVLCTDALEEWIGARRSKGDTLFDVSVGLAQLEDGTPPHLTVAFDRARYVTNVPEPADLTPPMGPFPLSKSASIVTITNHMLSLPPPTIQESRQVILEYVLAREAKLKDKKPGRAGKGTLAREGFEDLAQRMAELEDALRGAPPSSPRRDPAASDQSSGLRSPPQNRELDSNQQTGLALVLSLRMSLSYFTLQQVVSQLLLLALGDAERMLVQHIRRRMPGEGRWGVGRELEYVESLVVRRRPALRPAFRSAKARTLLPPGPVYPIQLPAPSKSHCIKQIQALVREYDASGPQGAAHFLQSHVPSGIYSGSFTPGQDRGLLGKRGGTASPTMARSREGTPQSPFTFPSPLASVSPAQAPSRASPAHPDIIENYTMELVYEFINREKREHMLKSRWAKSGRAQLSKDLGEMEAALCLANKTTASPVAPKLLPTFLLLRRTFGLPPSPLPQGITEHYLDIMPAPPDPDDVPFREPTVSLTTAALYRNPRLGDEQAYEVLEELVEFEKEKVEAAGGTREELVEWVVEQINSVQKRFPDGSYEDVFNSMKADVTKSPQASPEQPATAAFVKSPSIHRRAKSSAINFPNAPTSSETGSPVAISLLKSQHARSLSMPSRKGTYDSDSDSDSAEPMIQPRSAQFSPPAKIQSQISSPSTKAQPPTIKTSLPQLPPLDLKLDDRRSSAASGVPSSGGGWWDVVSAVAKDDSFPPAPWEDSPGNQSTGNASHHSRPSVGSSNRESISISVSSPLRPKADGPSSPGDSAQTMDFTKPMMDLDLHPESLSRPMSESLSPSRETDFNPGQAVRSPDRIHALPSPSRAGGVYLDNGRDKLPPPPLRFHQPNQSRGQTLGSNMSNSQPSPQRLPVLGESTPVPSAIRGHPGLSPGLSPHSASWLGTSSRSNSVTTATGPVPPSPSASPPSAYAPAFAPPPTPPPSAAPSPSPAPAPAPTKSIFGRSMSLARHKSKGKKDRENDVDKEVRGAKGKVLNDPGKWNRDLVANIMGPPASRG